ncbi:unnamed protein product [Arctogadus glacialis]
MRLIGGTFGAPYALFSNAFRSQNPTVMAPPGTTCLSRSQMLQFPENTRTRGQMPQVERESAPLFRGQESLSSVNPLGFTGAPPPRH